MLGVLFLILMVMISLSVALPKMAADIERDREVETVHRGKQYVRAIKLYYKSFQAYPPNMEALEKSNNIRFLRRRYKDPMTGKEEWKLIHFGQNKTPSYGFFGQPISGAGGATLAGTGAGGVAAGTAFGAVNTSNFGGSSSGSSSGSLSSGGPSFGGSTLGSTSTSAGSTDGSTSGTSSGSGTDTSGSGTTNGTGIASAFGNTSGSQTFGGGGIIGVSSTSPKASTIIWHKMKHFNEWEFWYDPNADRVMVSGNAGAIGTPAGGIGNTGISSPSSFGGSNSTNSTVGSPTGGQSTTPTTNPPTTTPQ
jgi:hypothetical protein